MLDLIIISYKFTMCLYLYIKEYLQYPVKIHLKYLNLKYLCGIYNGLKNKFCRKLEKALQKIFSKFMVKLMSLDFHLLPTYPN